MANKGYQELSFRITGAAPFLMHNGQLADPLNPFSKNIAQLSDKKGKNRTEADHLELGRREWLGGLYIMNGEPCVPGEMMEAALVKGAMKEKRGPQAKAGLLVPNAARLDYKGPRTPDELWSHGGFQLRVPVKVLASRIIRVRPKFDEWSAEVVIEYLPGLLNPSHIKSFLITAGEQIGIGDWRPRFGRFTVT